MGHHLARRFLMMILVLFGISIITFSLSRVIPADPAILIAGPRAGAEGLAKVRQQYGLDLPLWQQYSRYISGLLRLEFGQSFSSRRPVIEDIVEFLPATVELASFALGIAVISGISLGIISAIQQGGVFDDLSRLFAITGVSVPAFWIALLAQLLLYQHLGWLPFGGRISEGGTMPPAITGMLTVDSLLAGQLDTFWDSLRHLLLPALVLALEPLAILTRMTRTSMLEVMNETYIRTAHAKGLRERTVVVHHTLKNALPPIVTTIGLLIGYMMGGSILVESVFAWPGIGRYSAWAIVSADYNAIMGITLILAVIYLFTNLIVDLVCIQIDPRIRY